MGVCYDKRNQKYQAYCNINRKQIRIGRYNTIEQAFNAYKIAKENEVKRIAYNCVSKGFITQGSRLYNAMISYQVKIDD